MSANDNIADIGRRLYKTTMKAINVARAAIALVSSITICATPAMAEQLRFTGRTTANVVLIKDALRHIQLIGQGQRECGIISAVEASVLPESYSPSEAAYRVGDGPVIYESWSTTMCGDVVKFLISFWPAPDGGTLFAVGYPYPADAP